MNIKTETSVYIKIFICLFVFSLFGCEAHQQNRYSAPPPPLVQQDQNIDWNRIPPPPVNRELVAIAGFENKSTYSADRLWDTSGKFLASHLLRSGYFRVVEWEEMKRLFDWDTLSQVDIVKSPENMQRARRILLCEHFISGAITRFNVNTHSQVSSMSKAKTIDTTVRVDLLLQNAQTGEYMATGQGEHTIRQTFSGGPTGGRIGSWDSSAGDDALDMAIAKALIELISTFNLTGGSDRPAEPSSRQGGSGVILK